MRSRKALLALEEEEEAFLNLSKAALWTTLSAYFNLEPPLAAEAFLVLKRVP